MNLTLHEGETFTSRTITLSGHAFRNCTFDRCTMIVRDLPFALESSSLHRCQWRIECDVLPGEPETRTRLRQILDLIDGAADAVDS